MDASRDRRTPTAAARHALVLVFDGLSPGFLGPYGNTWVETPAFNQLAAESVLMEHCISPAPSSPANDLIAYQRFWDEHRSSSGSGPAESHFLEQCRRQDVRTCLLTDSNELAAVCEELSFEQIESLPPIGEFVRADDVLGTRCAQLMSQAVRCWQEGIASSGNSCLWIHTSALTEIWDAPVHLVEELQTEDDPQVSDSAEPPSLQLTGEVDPDASWSWAVSYAAQIRVLDECLAVLMEAVLNGSAGDSTLCVLTASHGYPLGEHGVVGRVGARPHSELVHVPWITRYPKNRDAALRSQMVTNATAIQSTLKSWLCLDGEEGPTQKQASLHDGDQERQLVLSRTAKGVSIRTPAWHAVWPIDEGSSLGTMKLYAKPDDRWDVNDVARLCPEICDLLETELKNRVSIDRGAITAGGGLNEKQSDSVAAPLHPSLLQWRE